MNKKIINKPFFKQYTILLYLICLLFAQNLKAQIKPTISYDSLSYFVREASNNPKRILQISDSLSFIAKEKKDTYKYAAMLLVNGAANSQLGFRAKALSSQIKAFDIFIH